MTYLSKCLVLIILVSPFALADTVLDELSICAKNDDRLQRLLCYDKLADRTKNSQPKQYQVPVHVATNKQVDNTFQSAEKIQSKPVLAGSELPKGSPVVQLLTTDDIADQQQANFGHENKQRTEDLINQIQATIIKIKKAPHGELIITLDNGQVWRQTDNTRLKFREDQMVIIKRGAFGSFFIGKENANKRIRAKRVK
jgi:hypothetical protein